MKITHRKNCCKQLKSVDESKAGALISLISITRSYDASFICWRAKWELIWITFESPTELIFKCCVYFRFLTSVRIYYGFFIKSRITLTVQRHPIQRGHLRMPHDLHHPFYILELKFISFNIYDRSYKSVFIILYRPNDTQRSRYPFSGFSIFLGN